MKISKILAREILDSRGFPTVESVVQLTTGHWGQAAVPSGASTGAHEAHELRDQDKNRYLGKGVRKAVQSVEGEIQKALIGPEWEHQSDLDRALCQLDGTPHKSRLGANAILSVSLATAWAQAEAQGVPFYRWIQEIGQFPKEVIMPTPLMNVINGGAHANNGLDFQEYMLVPKRGASFSENLRAGVETFHHLKKILASKGMSTAVGDEGGFAPPFQSNREPLELLMKAVKAAGYQPGKDMFFALDVAATEFFKDGAYDLKRESKVGVSSEKLASYYEELVTAFPIISIEDGMAEDDWGGWRHLTSRMGKTIQLVGDDLFVTNTERMKKGHQQGSTNAVLIKVNQIGTLSETLEAIRLAKEFGWRTVVSHRSGETEDVTIAHIAVGTSCGQIKTGSASRSDRIAKYNELLRIEDQSRREGRVIRMDVCVEKA